MSNQLVEIQPRELKFVCEVKKQSTSSVHLLNSTEQYVAFKVKTTSPKKYCVRPNVGIIKPMSTYDFTVTMQAQKSVPSDMQCKDKFLIQSTVVPYGTSEEEITSSMFSKESQMYIEETKLRVVFTIAPSCQVKPPASNVDSKLEPSCEFMMPKGSYSPVLLPVNGAGNQKPHYDTPVPKDTLGNRVENPPGPMIKPVEAVKFAKNVEEPRSLKTTDDEKSVKLAENMEELRSLKTTDNEKSIPAKDDKLKQVIDPEEVKLKLMREVERLTSQLIDMEVKLVEARYTIEKLKVEKSNTIREKETLKQDLAMSSPRSGARKVHVGFPPLFVCTVALISLMVGLFYRA